jgi:hypothetical protein
MSDQSSGNEVLDAVIEQNRPEPAAEPATAPEAAPESAPEAPAWAQKWGTADPAVAIEKAHVAWEEAQRHISSTRRAEEQQPQAPVDPYAFLPPNIDESQFKRIEAFAERDPKGAALWAYENQQTVGPQIANAVMRNWADQDFLGFQRWQAEQIYASQQQQPQQPDGAVMYEYEQRAELAVDRAGRDIANWEEYKPKIGQWLEVNETDAARVAWFVANDPRGLAPELERIYATIIGMEHVANLRSGGAPRTPSVDSSKTRTRTETRSTASPPAAAGSDDAISELILNAKR